ncbi:MAG TPA: AAA family ATPase [Candidatus Binataceae bacterium]|nr:AAA family ATPase [Candidatus Binataceae bacterium]
MEYYQYFRLEGPPFKPASPDGAVYFSPTHLQGLATLESGLAGDLTGLTLLTGEAGTGKTTLIYSLLQRDYKRVRIAHVDDPKLSFLEIMQAVVAQLKLYCAGSTKLDYLNTLDHLLELHGKEERIAVVVDEAQLMSTDVLEDLRLLSNRGHLQLILVGQPELAERLKKTELRQLNQRISSRGVLNPLTLEQAHMYVECRLSVAGGKCSGIFEPGALRHLLRRSDGLPRKINMLCYGAMLAAFDAMERKVSVRTAKKVAAEYQESVGIKNEGSSTRRFVMPAFIVGTTFASLLLLGLVRPDARSDWTFNRVVQSGQPLAQTVQPVKAVQLVRPLEQPGVEGHPVADVKPAAATSLVPQPVAKAAASTVPAVVVASAKGPLAEPAPASEKHAIPVTTAATEPSAVVKQQAGGVSATSRRTEITIRRGDTLEKLATQYLGSTSRMNELVGANPQLTNINQLNVGEVIYLPTGATSKASRDQAAVARAALNVEGSAGQ